MNTLAVVQARTSSSRLPGKVLLPLLGYPLVLFQLNRIRRCKRIDHLVLATSKDPTDDALADQVSKAGFTVFRGDLNDVLERFRACAVLHNAEVVVRLTGDCPFSDPVLIDEMVDAFNDGGWDYLSNAADSQQLAVPDGFDIEVFKAAVLDRVAT